MAEEVSWLGLIWGGLGGVISAGAVTWFLQVTWAHRNRPRLRAAIVPGSPACEAQTRVSGKSPDGIEIEGDAAWLRLIVQNFGKSTCKSCQVFIRQISRQSIAGTISTANWSDTLPMQWSVRDGEDKLDLLPNIDYTVDVFKLISSGGIIGLGICMKHPPYRYGEILSGPGIFRIDLVVGAENARPIELTAEMKWDGSIGSLAWIKEARVQEGA